MRGPRLQGSDQETVELVRRLLQVCSYNPPGEELEVAKLLMHQALAWGLNAELIPLTEQRANLSISLPGESEGPILLFCGHLDTVPPGEQGWVHEPLSGDLVDGVLHGRGAVDMKAGLAAMLAAMRALSTEGPRLRGRLRLIGLVGEEVDCIGAKAFLAAKGMQDVRWMIVGEPSNLDVIVAHRGALWLELTAHGKTAHGSMPHLGINAIDHLYKLLRAIRELRFDYTPHPMLSAPTVNVGTIHGGIKTNVVPDKCQATVDLRTLPGQRHDQIVDAALSIASDLEAETAGLKLTLRVVHDLPAVETAPDHPLVATLTAAVGAILERPPRVRGATYYTDASILMPPTQVPTVIFGPGDDHLAHQPDERVDVEQVVLAAQAYAGVARRLLA